MVADPEFRETERHFLESLRSRYEGDGYIFRIAPNSDELPSFLQGYTPDALAQKSGSNIAIELKVRQSPESRESVSHIRSLFKEHPGWRLHVYFLRGGPVSITIPPAGLETIRTRTDELRKLNAAGHRQAALVMAWSLLEAAVHSIGIEVTKRPLTPRTIVQTLGMNGIIEPEAERSLRELAVLRNRIVHGDIVAEVASADVEQILSAIEQALGASQEGS